MTRVTFSEELELVQTVLVAWGAPASSAHTQALWLTEADVRGHPSHGIQRLPVIVGRIRSGLIVPNAHPVCEWRSQSAVSIDGRRGFGPVVGLAAVGALVDAARTCGVAVAAIGGANHLGLLSPYVEEVASNGLVGLAMTTSEALVHAWGGRERMVGTNPIAVAIPAEPDPFVADMATGAVSMGRVIAHARGGLSLEEGWAIDDLGKATTDPHAAMRGAISPFGGPKGYVLGLAVEALVASLTGCALGTEVRGTLDIDQVANKGDLFAVFDPSRFGICDFKEQISRYLQTVRLSTAIDGTKPVMIPGDRSRAARSRGMKNGFDVDDASWSSAERLLSNSPAAGCVGSSTR